jgi:hypothetical protein
MQGQGANIKLIVPTAKVDARAVKLVQISASNMRGWDRYGELPTIMEFAAAYFSSLPKHLIKIPPSDDTDTKSLSAETNKNSKHKSGR